MEELRRASGWSTLHFTAFDTINHITVSEENENTLMECLRLSRYLHRLWTPIGEGSDIEKLNLGDGWIEVQPETAELISMAANIAHLTQGNFDPSIGWASQIWRAKRASGECPAPCELEHPKYDWRVLRRDNNRIWIPRQTLLDVGGIAKGAIADALTALLREACVDRALIDLGGNIAILGDRLPGQPWRVGLHHPEQGRDSCFAVYQGTNCSVVTSAMDERYIEQDGCRYGHLLDSKNGCSANTDLCTATVISADSTTADALSTACYVAGREGAECFLGCFPQAEAALLDGDGRLWLTEGLYESQRFQLLNSSLERRHLKRKGS